MDNIIWKILDVFFLWFLVPVMVIGTFALVVMAAYWLLFAEPAPSCEQLGGKNELLYYVPIQVGKTTVLNPVYECRVSKDFKGVN